MTHKWLPEIYYEENKEGLTNGLPFVKVPSDKEMPSAIFLCELKEIEEEEQNEMFVHMFCNMTTLKHNLDKETYDRVRACMGLEPVDVAAKKGKEITDRVNNNISSMSEK